MEGSWGAVWYKWAPALLTAPVMVVAYLGAMLVARSLVATHLGFWLVLVLTTALVGSVVAMASRGLQLFVRDAQGRFLRDPERQGNAGCELAVLACWFIFPHVGIHEPIWSYLVASLAIGAVGMAIFSFVASRNPGRQPLADHSTGLLTDPRRRPSTKIAPPWAQRVAKVCLALGTLSLFRLITDHTPHFLWGGLILLAVGALLPSLVVVLGGGREPQA